MQRLQAIALVLALLWAPLALVANSNSLARYEKQLSMTAHDDHCEHDAALGICGCYPGHAPVPAIVSPLPETVLSRPISLPALESRTSKFQPRDLYIPAGFFPAAFHPPRG